MDGVLGKQRQDIKYSYLDNARHVPVLSEVWFINKFDGSQDVE